MKRQRVDTLSYKLITLDDGQEVVAALPNGFDVEVIITSVKQQANKNAARTISKEQYDALIEPTQADNEIIQSPEDLQTNPPQFDTLEISNQETQ